MAFFWALLAQLLFPRAQTLLLSAREPSSTALDQKNITSMSTSSFVAVVLTTNIIVAGLGFRV